MLMVDGGSGSGVAVAAMMAMITWGQELDFFDGDMIKCCALHLLLAVLLLLVYIRV